MNKYIIPTILGFLTITSVVYGASVLFPYQGGTGTSTAPSYGQLLVGNAGGTYSLTATTSLGITGTVYTATYPILVTGSVISNAFSTTTSNTWGGTQAFTNTANFNTWTNNGGATTSSLSIGSLNGLLVGNNGTRPISTISTSSLAIDTSLSNTGTLGSQIEGTASTLSVNMANANSWTALQTFVNASTTLISADKIFVNGVGTSTFAGNVKVDGNLEVMGVSLLTLVTSGNLGVNGTLVVTGQTTLATSLTGLLKGSSGVVSVASAGSDYENPLTFSFPLKRTTNAITFVGLSTSTAPTVSNLSYWTGVNTFGTVATSSVTCSGGITCSNLVALGSSPTISSFSYLFPSNATSTLLTLSGGLTISAGTADISGATVKQHVYQTFAYSTSTAWTGTTTIALGVAFSAELWSAIKCYTDTGTLNVSVNDGTNRMNLLNASTTIGTFNFSTNNTFTASEKRYIDIGTPASTPTKISCTTDVIVNN